MQLLDKEDEVLLVLLGAAPLARVLPVQVKTVEVVSPDEAEGGPGEGTPVLGAVLCCTVLYCTVPVLGAGRHHAVLLAALVPAADGEGDLHTAAHTAGTRASNEGYAKVPEDFTITEKALLGLRRLFSIVF